MVIFHGVDEAGCFHGVDEAGCSSSWTKVPKDVEPINLDDMELEENQESLAPKKEGSCPPLAACAQKRTDMWMRDAAEFLSLEPNKAGAAGIFTFGQVAAQDEVCVNIPVPSMLHSYAEYREKCVICYHKSRELQNVEMEQWMLSCDAHRIAVECMWSLGQGFFAIRFDSKSAAWKVLSNGEMPFNEDRVIIVPYIPCFFPAAEGVNKAWPVWVSFPRLPLFLRPFLREIASGLGKVLHVPQPGGVISSATPRVCILWDATKKAPGNVKACFDHLGTMKLDVIFDPIHAPVDDPGGARKRKKVV